MRVTTILLLSVASGTFLWWVWPASVDQPVESTVPPSSAPVHKIATAAVELRDSVREEPLLASAPSDVRPIPASAHFVEVRVVDAASRQPVEGADVTWVDDSAHSLVEELPESARLAYYRSEELELLARDFGWRTRTDERGNARVHVAPAGARTSVFVSQGDRHGYEDVTANDLQRGVVINLELDRTVTVRVVDHDGKAAAEVPVELADAAPDTERWLAESPRDTDAMGLVTFSHLQKWCKPDETQASTGAKWRRAWAGAKWRATVRLPGIVGHGATFDALSPPSEPVELTLPPTGAMVVRVLHPGRRVEKLSARAWSGAPDDSDAEDEAWHRRGDDDGMIRFPFVPLACNFEVKVEIGDLELQQTVAGPTNAGQVVHVDFEVPAESVALVGRVLTNDGQAVKGRRLDVDYSSAWSSGTNSIDTDDQGRFVWHLGTARDGPMRLDELVVSLQRGPLDVLYGSVAPRELGPGIHDLGDIRLDHLPTVVAGRFVFDRPSTDWFDFEVERWFEGNATLEARWYPVDDLHEHRDGEGNFVVFGAAHAGRYRLSFDPRYVLPREPVEFDLGSKDLVVPLQRGNSMRVETQLPEGVRAEALDFDLVADGSGAPPLELRLEDPWLAMLDSGALPAGTYTLRVRLHSVSEVLATIPDLVLPGPDGETHRRIEVDLRDRLQLLRIRVALPDEENGAVVFIDQRWDGATVRGHRVLGKELVLPVPPRPVDLVVARHGWHPVSLRSVQGTVDVRLDEPWPVKPVTVRGVPPLPDGVELDFRAEPPDHRIKAVVDGGWIDRGYYIGPPMWWDAVRADGTYEVLSADVERPLTVVLTVARDRERQLRSVSPSVLTSGTSAITITLDPSEIRAALDESRRDRK